MDSSLLVPRLRTTRLHSRPRVDHVFDTPQAGPSRLTSRPDLLDAPSDGDEDNQPTPRVPSRPQLEPFADRLSPDNPIHRLRAALSLNQSRVASRRPPSPTDSDMDSDFEPPNMTTNATEASIAKESLKEIFSRALMDTPQKSKPKSASRRRRNSDTSEVDSSPRVQLVERERADNKGTRQSVSDEDTDRQVGSSRRALVRGAGTSTAATTVEEQEPDAQHKSSAASTYDSLRQRLASAVGRPQAFSASSFAQRAVEEQSEAASAQGTEFSEEPSGDTAKAFRNLDPAAMSFDPPDVMSTPMHSVQTVHLPSELQLQSNLMSQDSDMQKALKDFDTFGGDTTVNRTQRRVPFTPSRPSGEPSDHDARAHSKSHSTHGLPLGRRVSLDNMPRPSASRRSSLSAADFREPDDKEKLRERERAWNRPSSQNNTPDSTRHYHSHNSPSGASSPHPRLKRRDSTNSMNSFDGRSSVASSVGSRAELRERMKELEDERVKERERLWNRSQPRSLSRSTSSLSLRNQDSPSRPGSALSYATPSRSSSRASSVSYSAGKDRDVTHERERNWNAPHPKRAYQDPPRSISPMPRHSSGGSNSQSRLPRLTGSPSPSPASRRNRTVSQPTPPRPARPGSPLVRLSQQQQQQQQQQQHHHGSPAALLTQADEPEATRPMPFGSRFGWSFPKSRGALPPLDFDDDDDGRHQVHSHHAGGSSLSGRRGGTPSRIPVRSPGRMSGSDSGSGSWSGDVREGGEQAQRRKEEEEEPDGEAERENGEVGEGAGLGGSYVDVQTNAAPAQRHRIEPVDLIHADTRVLAEQDLVPTDVEGESDVESQVTSTPLARPSTIPEEEPELDDNNVSDELPSEYHSQPQEYEDVEGGAPSFPEPVRMHTPPPLLPDPPQNYDAPSPLFGLLRTPPRPPRFQQFSNMSGLEFQTPSPPRGMPDLPGPPSSSEDEPEEEHTAEPRHIHGDGDMLAVGNFSTMKTPKPPGAWAATPLPPAKPDVQPQLAQETGDLTPTAIGNTTVGKTPAPPGAWAATPGAGAASSESLRRKSILKVRFDVESNTSLEEVPLVGPGDSSTETPGDSISEVFPPVRSSKGKDKDKDRERDKDKDKDKRPSAGVRVLDAFGREADDAAPPPPAVVHASETASTTVGQPSPRNRSAVRIVDAMGHEVDSEMSAAEDSSIGPRTHNEAVRRLRATVARIAEDLGESDDSRILVPREDRRLDELYRTSLEARTTRKGLSETIQKHKDEDAELRAKYGSLRDSMQRTKLLPPVNGRSSRFSINFMNAWVLCGFLALQVFLVVYMYQLSAVRAKHLFLTTYYDAFEPALFAHIPKSDALHRATPMPSSTSVPFSVSDVLSRDGWRGLLDQVRDRMFELVREWHAQVWDAWRRDARTHWPPT